MGAHDADNAATRASYSQVPTSGLDTARVLEHAPCLMPSAYLPGNSSRVIGRLTIRDDDLDERTGIVLSLDRAEASVEGFRLVTDGDEQADR